MKLRIRISRQTRRAELPGEEPTLTELVDHIRTSILSTHGLSEDTVFGLSLNGSEILTDAGQTLASCGIVSGDLICVVLPDSATPTPADTPTPPSSAEMNDWLCDSQPSTSSSNAAALPQPSRTSPGAAEGAAAAAAAELGPSEPGPSVCSWEPMLCSEAEDGSAPMSLELLYDSAQVTSPCDAIMVAGHMIMMETGFVPQGGELKAGQMPDGWRSVGGVWKLHYTHPLCEDGAAALTAVCMGPALVIHATVRVRDAADAVEPGFKLQVNPCKYVTHDWPSQSATAAFKSLRKLSRVFSEQLAYPLIFSARDAMSLPAAFGLAALPPELLLRIVRLLDVSSVLSLSGASRHFSVATADWTLWRHLCLRDFSGSHAVHSTSSGVDWKMLYKTCYQAKSRARRTVFEPFRDILEPPPSPPAYPWGVFEPGPFLPRPVIPRPRYDPISPFPPDPTRVVQRRPGRGRAADIRRGFL